MSHKAFPRGNKIEVIDSLVDYISFIQNIAAQEKLPGAVLTLAQTIDELKLEKIRRIERREAELQKTA